MRTRFCFLINEINCHRALKSCPKREILPNLVTLTSNVKWRFVYYATPWTRDARSCGNNGFGLDKLGYFVLKDLFSF